MTFANSALCYQRAGNPVHRLTAGGSSSGDCQRFTKIENEHNK